MSCIKILKVSSVLLCLVLTTSCAIKTGINNLDNYHHPLDIDEEPFRYWETETFTPKFANDHMDITLGFGYNSGREKGRIEIDDGWWRPEIETFLWDIHLGTRIFPLGFRDRKLIPYLGGGFGYFEYDMNTRSPGDYEYVYSDEFHDYYELDIHHDTIAHGYFSYLSTGLFLPLGERHMLQLEYRYDFDKDYKQYDMSGYQITIGFAYMHK